MAVEGYPERLEARWTSSQRVASVRTFVPAVAPAWDLAIVRPTCG